MISTVRRGLVAGVVAVATLAVGLPSVALAAAPGDTIAASEINPNQAGSESRNLSVLVSNTTAAPTLPVGQDMLMYLTSPQGRQYDARGITQGTNTTTGIFDLFPVGGAPAAPGLYTLTICGEDITSPGDCDPLGDTDIGTEVFQVVAPTPVVSSISPATRAAGGTGAITLSGTGLAVDGTIALVDSTGATAAVTPTGYIYNGGTSVTATLALPATLPAGQYDVVYKNAGNTNAGTLARGLTVTPRVALAAASPINPPGVGVGATNYPFEITGTEFQPGATVQALSGTTATGVTFSVTSVSSTKISGTVSVPAGTAAAVRDLVVTNPDGGNDKAVGGFTVYPAPTLTSASPTPRGQGWTGDLTITGSGFRSAPAAPTVDLGTGITHGLVTVTDATHLLVKDVVIGSAAPTGGRTITVSPLDGAAVTSAANFLTVNAAPVPSTISPSHAGRGQTVTLNVTGSGFTTAANSIVLSILKPADRSVVCSSTPVTPSSTTQLTAACALPADLQTGGYLVRLTSTVDGGTASCVAPCFTADAFQVDTVSPPSGGLINNDPTVVPISVTGSALPSDGRIVFRHNPTLADQPDITAVACPAGQTCGVAADGKSARQYFSFNGVAPGKYDVIVVGSVAGVSQSGQCSCQITVVAAGAPTVTAVSPTSIVQGATSRLVTVTGTNLYPGDRAVISGGDGKVTVVPGSESVAADHRSMTFRVTVDKLAAAPGSNTLKIVDSSANPFSSSATSLTITKAPVLNAGAPNSLGRGASTGGGGYVVTGQNFVAGASPSQSSVFSFCPGVTASTPTITKGQNNADDVATMALTIAQNAQLGSCAVTVTNPDSGVATSSSLLSITPAPVATKLAPSALAKGKNQQDVVLTGTGFASGATVSFLRAGSVDPKITVHSVSVTNAGQLTAKVSTALDALAGARSVQVTNPDKGTATCTDCFAIAVAPQGPATVLARPADGQVLVSWTAVPAAANGGSEITSYTAKATPGGKEVVVPAAASTARLTGLANGTAYTVTVTATNAAGTSPAVAAATPVTPAPITRLLSMKPTQIVNTGTGVGAGPGRITTKDFVVSLASPPANAVGAVISATVSAPRYYTTLTVFGSGTSKPSPQITSIAGTNKTNTIPVMFASGGGPVVTFSLTRGPANVTAHQVGWLIRGDQDSQPAATVGGRYVPTFKELVNYQTSGTTVPGRNVTHYYDLGTAFPDAEAIAVEIYTANTRTDGAIQAYSAADGPLGTTHSFKTGRATSTLAIARISSTPTPDPNDAPDKMCRCVFFKVNGQTGAYITMVGYWDRNTTPFGGRVVSVTPSRVLVTGGTRVGEISGVSVPSSIPAGVTGVIVNIAAYGSEKGTTVRAYANDAPTSPFWQVSVNKGDTATGTGIVTLGADRKLRFLVKGAAVKVIAEVVGYVN